MPASSTETVLSLTDQILQAIDAKRHKRVRKLVRKMHPAKVAALLERLDPKPRRQLWQQVDSATETIVLGHLSPSLQAELSGSDSSDLPNGDFDAASSGHASPMPTELAEVRTAIEQGKLKHIGHLFGLMHPAKVAGLLEALPPEERTLAWSMLETEQAGFVLTYLHTEISVALAQELDIDDLIAASMPLALDDLVDLIQVLPAALGRALVQSFRGARRSQLESMLSYPRNTAGGLMNTDAISVRADVKAGAVLRYLRLIDELPVHTDSLMVVDRTGKYEGVLLLTDLVTASLDAVVSDLMRRDVQGIPAMTESRDVARIFQDHNLVTAAVVDEGYRLIGRITVDDVMDLIQEDSAHSVMSRAGLDEEADMFAPVWTSSRRRAVWLGINLLTAFLAAWVIGQFQGALEQLVALAVLMPVVASMGGIAGSQTLTLVIRGLALKQIQPGNLRVLVGRELGVSLINGVLWASVVALLSVAWFGNWGLGGVIAVAMWVNLLCAALAGLVIPLLMSRSGVDPALAGGVVLTTVTDVVGFLSFLGLATWLLV